MSKNNTENIVVKSLISREASTAIKGLLLLLIVFGHTGMLTTNYDTGEKTFLWNWLYTFHVYVFFILPFIYGYSRRIIPTKAIICNNNANGGGGANVNFQYICIDFKHNFFKIGIPYFWFFLFSALVFVTVGGGNFNFGGMLYALFFGNEPLIDKYIGFNFMWFLPSMLALVTLKSVWYNSKRGIKVCIIMVSIILWSLYLFNIVSKYTVGMCVPFALSQGFYYIVFGIVSRRMLETNISTKKYLAPTIVLVLLMTVLLYCHYMLKWETVFVPVLSRLMMPVLVFLLLYSIREVLSKSEILKLIGKYSLQIYLIHGFIIYGLTVVVTHYVNPSFGLGIVIYFVGLAISIGLAVLMMKMPFVNSIVFPKSR